MIKQFIDIRQIDRVDLVGNDSGTAIAQVFAANNPKRVRTLILTDGDTYNNWPPAALEDFVTLITQGGLRHTLQTMTSRRDIFCSERALGLGYENAADITDETVDAYLQPFLSSPQRLRALEHFCEATLNCETMIRIESLLCNLYTPTLIAWATDDIFFDVKWAEWLAKAIPGTEGECNTKMPSSTFLRSADKTLIRNFGITGQTYLCWQRLCGRDFSRRGRSSFRSFQTQCPI